MPLSSLAFISFNRLQNRICAFLNFGLSRGYHWANGPDWTSTIALIPWDIYMFYGDISLLEKCYDNIKRFVDLVDYTSPTVITDWALGDWHPVVSKAPREFMSTIYFFASATILSKTALLIGKMDDNKKYSELAEKIKDAINTKYLNRETAIYGSGFQTELSFALYWGLVPEDLVEKVAGNLAKRVIADGRHVDVGQLGSKTLLNALSENGYADLAFEVASQETYPSWGWWIVNGATTFLEHWKIGVASLNHINYGEISAWFYKAPGGIFPDESQPGFKNVILKPNFVTGLEHFEAIHEGPYGTIISSWARSGGEVSYKVTIPANSTATLYLRDVKEVLENNKDLTENMYVRVEKTKGSDLKIFLQSGNYKFLIH